MGSSRRIEKCPQSGWGCMGGGATDQCLEGNPYPVQLYYLFIIVLIVVLFCDNIVLSGFQVVYFIRVVLLYVINY